jgi:solute carrier family 35 protein E1
MCVSIFRAQLGAFQAASHLAGVVALGSGAVSFTQLVKASEPIFSALVSAVESRTLLPLPVYLSLIPVIAGVGLATITQLDFTWRCLVAGTLYAARCLTHVWIV